MSTVVKDLGAVSAYAYAVEKGYTGTEAEYAELMASYADVGQTAVDAKDTAVAAKTAAETAAGTATNKASEASQSASTASTKATEATTAATSANTAKVDAVTAKTAAETAQGKAEDAQAAAEAVAESIPSDYSQLSEDVSDLKEDLSELPKIATPEESEADLYISDANGNVLAEFADGHIVTKNFTSESIGDLADLSTEAKSNIVEAINEAAQSGGADNIVKEASKTEADLYICDSFGNVIAEFKNGHIVTKNFDSADYADVLLNIDSLSTDISALESAMTGIVARNKEAVSGIYTSCRYGFRDITNYPANRFSMLIGGDIHGDSVRMNNHVDFLNALDCFDAGILLGDICGNMWYDNSTYYTEAIARANKPFLTVVGNHDVQWQGSGEEPTQSAIYNKIIAPNIQYADLASGEEVAGKCYYYKDFATKKIRVIVLYQYDYAYSTIDNNESPYYYGYNCYQQAQIDWLISTLNNTPADYAVVIASHNYPCSVVIDTDAVFTSNHWPSLTGTPSTFIDRTNGLVVEDIVNAWVNGTTISKTYNYTPTGWGSVTASADFTSRGTGEFIVFLGGHWHNSIISKTLQYGFLAFNIATASLSAGRISSDQARIVGERSEDSIVSLAVDRKNKKVNLFAVGAHWCDDARDRLYASYSYVTE